MRNRNKKIFSLIYWIIYLISTVTISSSLLFFIKPKLVYGEENLPMYDDFEDGNSDGWNEVTFNGDWYVDNGEYIGIASPSGNVMKNSYTFRGSKNWQNYRFSAKVRGINNVDKTIFFYFNEDKAAYEIDLRSRYATSDGNDIVLFKSPNLDTNDGHILAIKEFNNEPNTDYLLSVEVRNLGEDVSIKIYIDSDPNPIIDYLDKKTENSTPIYQGAVGLLVWPQTPNTTAFDNIKVESLETITPIPSPTTTPFPDPAPSTKKVILSPGMGASWNTDAILNCKLEGYTGNWNIAPFAEELYNPIIKTLQENGFEIHPYYYDWRKRIPSHTDKINDLISNLNLGEKEKVHFIGHSMGGLVGRAYLENKEQESKIDKYISVGSPHQGTALAYPAWYGGEIWNNNLVTKIASTLLLKRCGTKYPSSIQTIRNVFPSFQDLLPTYAFLRDIKNKQLKKLNTNIWLLESNFPQNTNATIATLSGFGFDTLSNIKVKEPTSKEVKSGLWEEGKPAGKEFSTEGDATVLVKSSKINSEQVKNFEINQDHGELIYSTKGINTIINYLKGDISNNTLTSTIEVASSIQEPESALVIVTYPASFISFDTENKPRKDKNNVITYFNPKSGKYKVGVLPLASESTLLIGQFLKNGEYSWKEYKIKGKLPLIKIISFNENNITENQLLQ